jgi:DNA-damage-inducible protein J
MLKTANLHVHIDPEIKSSAEELFSSLGVTISDAITMFFRQSLTEKDLPFEFHEPRYNAETEAAIQEARDIRAGKVYAKSYSTLAEFYADLDSEDDDDDEV